VASDIVATFLDLSHAARVAGLSVRQFRRVIDEERIPCMTIGEGVFEKRFVLAAQLRACIERRSMEPPEGYMPIEQVALRLKCSCNTARKRLKIVGSRHVTIGHRQWWDPGGVERAKRYGKTVNARD
jgi:hypothetical protein